MPTADVPLPTTWLDAPRRAGSAVTNAPRVIAVAGNMGAGKSSLVEWLRQQYGITPFFEPNDENPYLEDFYRDMQRWATSSQLWFLVRRFRIHRQIAALAPVRGRATGGDGPCLVQDRTIYEDAEVFAAHLHERGFIDERDWQAYRDLFDALCEALRPPDLMIYLRCPLRTLTRRIRGRGRAYEQKLPRHYLASLERLYEAWFARYDLSPTLVLETDRLDYVEHLFDRLELVNAIERHVGIRPQPPASRGR